MSLPITYLLWVWSWSCSIRVRVVCHCEAAEQEQWLAISRFLRAFGGETIQTGAAHELTNRPRPPAASHVAEHDRFPHNDVSGFAHRDEAVAK